MTPNLLSFKQQLERYPTEERFRTRESLLFDWAGTVEALRQHFADPIQTTGQLFGLIQENTSEKVTLQETQYDNTMRHVRLSIIDLIATREDYDSITTIESVEYPSGSE